jgi:hypothetical protein
MIMVARYAKATIMVAGCAKRRDGPRRQAGDLPDFTPAAAPTSTYG